MDNERTKFSMVSAESKFEMVGEERNGWRDKTLYVVLKVHKSIFNKLLKKMKKVL